MLKQYKAIQNGTPCNPPFSSGRFYEMFMEDAETAAGF